MYCRSSASTRPIRTRMFSGAVEQALACTACHNGVPCIAGEAGRAERDEVEEGPALRSQPGGVADAVACAHRVLARLAIAEVHPQRREVRRAVAARHVAPVDDAADHT